MSDFFRGAWLPDLVQRSNDVLIGAAARIGNLTHLVSGVSVDLRAAHFVSL